jgi:hypothetical protein
MKKTLFFISIFLIILNFKSLGIDYVEYHKGVIKAEQLIFINNDSISGLEQFKKTFESFDFAFVDDCMEAFQVALYFKRDDYAMIFIKKALKNGFELKLFRYLDLGCPCTFYSDRSNVTIHKKFIEQHKHELEIYADKNYSEYIKRIDKNLLTLIIKRHVREQLFKNGHSGLAHTFGEQEVEYQRICDDNLRFMDSLAVHGIYLGERNLGIYTDRLADSLDMPFHTIKNCIAIMLKYYELPANTIVPVDDEKEYFDMGFVFNMEYHNDKSYDHIAKYKENAIKRGYLHPREYACLQFDNIHASFTTNDQLRLMPNFSHLVTDLQTIKIIDKRREELLLPSYEIDVSKHIFEHAHNLTLFFGFFNSTR